MTNENDSASNYHVPVLLHECINGLNIRPDGVYVDATFGGGGHSAAILQQLSPKGKLIAFDQDQDAVQNLPDDERVIFVNANFCHLKRYLRLHQHQQVDGILADLGVSSFQFDTAERGFSYRFEGPLDMRMNQQAEQTALSILQTYDAANLQSIFSEYGEVRNAKTLANAIVENRNNWDMHTTSDLVLFLEQYRMGEKYKYLAQVFQALRMEVNQELAVLKDFLTQCTESLATNGRVAVITFHSLEDRLVKNYFKNATFEDEPAKDFFGNFHNPLKLITKKPITATTAELKQNKRAHSAKLRVAEKK